MSRTWIVPVLIAGALLPLVVLAVTPEAQSAQGARFDAPRKRRPLLRFLREHRYRDTFTAEPAAHSSDGPHGGTVRTWYSPRLVEDLAEDREVFRRGGVMVKELFLGGDGSADPIGYAVMIKTQRTKSPRRRSWRYYETFDAEQKRFDFAGRGLRLCADCHSDGTDFLLSTFRPER